LIESGERRLNTKKKIVAAQIVDRELVASMFVESACQYYISARFAMRGALLPIMGNLFHFAIEYLLKGGLLKCHELSEPIFRGREGHDLEKLWLCFKQDFNIESNTECDETIHTLHHFEAIRYPEKIALQGMIARADWNLEPSKANFDSSSYSPKYTIVVAEIDDLLAYLFKVSSWNPQAFFQRFSFAREIIEFQNSQSKFLMGGEG
jgi:hypothetical protein